MAAPAAAPSSCTFSSSISMSAATAQYPIDSGAPVKITLLGPKSYCYLKTVEITGLKEILFNVGKAFEDRSGSAFFTVHHTITPTEATEVKSGSQADGVVEDHNSQLITILALVKEVVNNQATLRCLSTVSDIKQLVVSKTIYGHQRAYELEITLSEKAMEMAEKSTLNIREYVKSTPPGTIAVCLGVGQHTLV